jgi:hypothetical protein
MKECDGFFDREGIPYREEFQDAAVRAVRAADFYNPPYKKWLILCWFDTCYGIWNGTRFDLRDSRVQMSDYLTKSPYRTFEELLANKEDRQNGS